MFWPRGPSPVGKLKAAPTIPPQHAELWSKIAAFEIDDPAAATPLSRRLANEQDWSHEYALRVVEEYRKFIFMCMISPTMCTPSLRVDEAWHLHLIYTRSYWERLCVRTLGRLIHHEPGSGNAAEAATFDGHYNATLDLYASIFGEPPEDIWGHKEGAQRKPASCAAYKSEAPEGPLPNSDHELLLEIEKAAARLKRYQPKTA